jgi:hypothetical protein
LVPYLKYAKKWDNRAFLRKDGLIVNRRTYDLSYLKENIQLEAESRQLDTPAGSQVMTQQTGNPELQEQNKARRPEDRAMGAVYSCSTDARKTTSLQRESTGHGTAS